jgi:phenylalanyl-tRNA synthetase beta chain
MRVSSAWIKKWLCRTMLNDRQMVEALEQAGIEIEQVIFSTEIDKRVVVALVKKVVQHPGADRLRLVEVEIGAANYNIVCGAPNVREGLKVALAQIGTVLPSGDKIQKAKLRGEVSEGMICSEFELGLGNDHNGIMELSSDLEPGTPLCDIYPGDAVIDVKTPANRWDVQSITGLAREIAGMTSAELVPLSPPAVKFSGAGDVLAAKPAARRYSLARLTVRQPAHSPREVVSGLRAAGVRSIGPVVDITNYVMLETGQPLHAFDAAKVTLPVSVRSAKAGETLETLDGVNRKLSPADLVIADAKGPIALAGLMGGKATEVTAETSEILLESAVFDGAAVRKMAQRQGLRTEASARFERNIPVALPPIGLGRAVELLGETAEAELVEAYEAPFDAEASWGIALPLPRLNQLLGFGISYKEAVAALEKLGIEPKSESVGKMHKSADADLVIDVPKVPWWRPDLREGEDLVEEIVRVVGYDKVPSTIPAWRPRKIEFDRLRAVRRRVRDILWAAGAFEVMTYSFVSAAQLEDLDLPHDQHLKLKNPLSTEQAYLRSALLPSHLATIERNRTYAKAVKFYEISKVFLKRAAGEQPDEPLRLAVTVLEPAGGYAVAKGVLDALAADLNLDLAVRPAGHATFAPGRYGEIWLGETKLGGIGQIHPARAAAIKLDGDLAYFELDLTPLMEQAATRRYAPQSAFPTTTRDVALLVPYDVTWRAVRDATADWNVAFVSDYFGKELPEGMKGMTIRLTLALPDRTPTEAQAAELEQSVVARLTRKLGAKPRT